MCVLYFSRELRLPPLYTIVLCIGMYMTLSNCLKPPKIRFSWRLRQNYNAIILTICIRFEIVFFVQYILHAIVFSVTIL